MKKTNAIGNIETKSFAPLVRAGIDAGVQVASQIGEVVSELVIPRPIEELVESFEK